MKSSSYCRNILHAAQVQVKVLKLEDCKMLKSHPNSSGPSLGNSANWSCGILVKNLLTLTGLLDSSVVSSLSSTQKVMSSNLGAGTFSNWRQSSKQRYTSQNSDKRAYFLPAFRAQNEDIWRKSDRKCLQRSLHLQPQPEAGEIDGWIDCFLSGFIALWMEKGDLRVNRFCWWREEGKGREKWRKISQMHLMLARLRESEVSWYQVWQNIAGCQ